MYFLVLFALAFLSTCCFVKNDDDQDHCDQWLESSTVSMELSKRGFHRDLTTTVELKPDVLHGVSVLLQYRWPSGVYVDPYQLASLSDQNDWQILLDSSIDLEVPAHKTLGFISFVYPSNVGPTSSPLKVTIPVHGRYHEPSLAGETFTTVHIEPPDLLLRTGKCLNRLEPYVVVDAPCTVSNSSMCAWVQMNRQQEERIISFQVPVGDGLVVMPVCVGTFLVTIVCCVALSKYMLKHQIT
uniref:Phosphatidylinositol-glycan biosynthesis class X protein n=1 Tax=Iconisemion striatum TaxID=60296 RepID=A0A1A7XFF6_9TELE